MSIPQFTIVRLHTAHDRTGFASGDEPLDRFIKEQAVQAMRDRACAVFVATPVDDPTRVVGYYTLSPATLSAEGVPEDLRAKLPRYPALLTALLGRLAVHEGYAGRSLSSLLIANALRRTEAQRDLPVMFLVVDAYEQARGFYQQLGFVPVVNSQTRLFFALTSLARRGPRPGGVTYPQPECSDASKRAARRFGALMRHASVRSSRRSSISTFVNRTSTYGYFS